VIAYDLRCSAAHRFEGWFASSQDYDRQFLDGLITCPVCNDIRVTKAPSAPYVGRKGNQSIQPAPTQAASISEPVTAPVTNAPQMSEAVSEIIQKLAVMQSEALKGSDWVGRDFAEEARSIHYGESKDRLIHGEASPDEALELAEEGIAVAPLPLPYIPPLAKN
jgi:hypothetical protein